MVLSIISASVFVTLMVAIDSNNIEKSVNHLHYALDHRGDDFESKERRERTIHYLQVRGQPFDSWGGGYGFCEKKFCSARTETVCSATCGKK